MLILAMPWLTTCRARARVESTSTWNAASGTEVRFRHGQRARDTVREHVKPRDETTPGLREDNGQ
eukprot:107422-Rhodomonas_salina.1